jgi:hypothetical protein
LSGTSAATAPRRSASSSPRSRSAGRATIGGMTGSEAGSNRIPLGSATSSQAGVCGLEKRLHALTLAPSLGAPLGNVSGRA